MMLFSRHLALSNVIAKYEACSLISAVVFFTHKSAILPEPEH